MQESPKFHFDLETRDSMAPLRRETMRDPFQFDFDNEPTPGKDALWVLILTLSSIGFSYVFACATPFAALGALAATRMRLGTGLALIVAAWAAKSTHRLLHSLLSPHMGQFRLGGGDRRRRFARDDCGSTRAHASATSCRVVDSRPRDGLRDLRRRPIRGDRHPAVECSRLLSSGRRADSHDQPRRIRWPSRDPASRRLVRSTAGAAPVAPRARRLTRRGFGARLSAAAHRLSDGRDGRDPLPSERRAPHRRRVRLCGEAFARPAREAARFGFHFGGHSEDSRARARSRSDLLRFAGTDRG